MNWLKKFMIGRNGTDQLSMVLLLISVLFSIISRLTNSQIVNMLSMITLIVATYRILSKNIPRRYQENIKFLKTWNPIKYKAKRILERIKDIKDYKHFKCTNCKQALRVPRGKGKISITCPKCKLVMIKKS